MHVICYIFNISSPGSLLASIKKKYLLWKENRNFQLTITQGDRCASCENIVSRSQTLLPDLTFFYVVLINLLSCFLLYF